jgi:hypothetical protein
MSIRAKWNMVLLLAWTWLVACLWLYVFVTG